MKRDWSFSLCHRNTKVNSVVDFLAEWGTRMTKSTLSWPLPQMKCSKSFIGTPWLLCSPLFSLFFISCILHQKKNLCDSMNHTGLKSSILVIYYEVCLLKKLEFD